MLFDSIILKVDLYYLGTTEAFKIFLKAIFYIGKGTQSRPFAHFKEAIKSHLVQPSNQFQVE